MIGEGSYLQVNKLNWLYLDVNSYFATIEQQINPDLRQKPVAVVPVISESMSILAASFEAKLKGIRTGTKVFEARKLCPEIICVEAKHDIYVKYHNLIFQEVDKYLHVDHIFSIDEGACRLTGEYCNEEKAIEIAEQIKAGIKKNVGDYITCSIGIAPNRYLAKIATDMKKPNGLIIIKPEDIPQKMFTLKLKDLPGVGRRVYQRLNSFGINTVERLYGLDSTKLKLYWGSIWGAKCWYLLRGADLPFEEAKSTTIGHSQVLAPELKNIVSARSVALLLVLKTASRLRALKFYASYMTLSISLPSKKGLKTNISIGGACDSFALSSKLLKEWDRLIENNNVSMVNKISISLHGLMN